MVEIVKREFDGIQMVFHGLFLEREVFDIDAGRNSEWCGPLTPPE
jgi:hypothetical protein